MKLNDMSTKMPGVFHGMWILVLCLLPSIAYGDKFLDDELNYSFEYGSSSQVCVTGLKNSSATSINIPATVLYEYTDYSDQDDDGHYKIKHRACTVTRIGRDAFYNCSWLTGNLNIPDSVTCIDYFAFCNCSGLTGDIKLPSNLTSIGTYAFHGCSGLTGDLRIPDTVMSIGNGAFHGCSSLTGCLTISDKVTSIEINTFEGCSGLTSVIIPNTVTRIGREAFRGCSGLKSVTIPNGVTSIETRTFGGCSSLTNAIIPDSIKSIGWGAFGGCSSLKELIIPVTVTDIWCFAFDGVAGCINFKGRPPRFNTEMYDSVVGRTTGTYLAEYSTEWNAYGEYWHGLQMSMYESLSLTLSASDGTVPGGIEVTWTDGGCEQYELFRGESANGPFTYIATVSGNRYFDSDFSDSVSSAKWGQPYWYYVNRVSGQKGAQPKDGTQRDSNVDVGLTKSGGELPKIEEVDVGELWLSGEGPYYCFLTWNNFDRERYYVSSISFDLIRSDSGKPVWTSVPKKVLSGSDQLQVFDVSLGNTKLIPKGKHGQHKLKVTWEIQDKVAGVVVKDGVMREKSCDDVKVFFHKYGTDKKRIPNWFHYWWGDGAISGVIFDEDNSGLLYSGFFRFDRTAEANVVGGHVSDAGLEMVVSNLRTPSGFPPLYRLSGSCGHAYSIGKAAAAISTSYSFDSTSKSVTQNDNDSNVGLKCLAANIAHEKKHGEVADATYGVANRRNWLFIGNPNNKSYNFQSSMDLLNRLAEKGYTSGHLLYGAYYNQIADAVSSGKFVTDFDGDGIADDDEANGRYKSMGFSTSDPDTYNFHAVASVFNDEYDSYGDNEVLARDAEQYGEEYIGINGLQKDWAWPGYNIAETIGLNKYSNKHLMSLSKSDWKLIRNIVTGEAQQMSRNTKASMSTVIQTAKGSVIRSAAPRMTLAATAKKVGLDDEGAAESSCWHGTASSLSDIFVSTGDVHVVSCVDAGVIRDGSGRVSSLGWSLALTNATDEAMTVKLRCYLADSATNALAWAATNVECVVGLTTVEMRFDAEDVFLWNTSRLMLYAVTIESSVGDMGWMISEQAPCALTAAEYSAADLANDKGRIVPSSVAVIATSEGVMVTGEVVRVSGDAAQIYASLTDTNGLAVTSAMIDAPGVGTNDFAIFFPGDELYRLAKPLPYVVDSLRLAENDVTVHEVNAVGTVDAEDARWFRPADLTIHALAGSGAWSEPQRGADGLCSQITYSFVVSNAEDTVKACHARATLLGTNEEHICSLNLPVELSAGLNTVSMSFSSIDMKAHEYDGGVYRIGNVFVESDDGNEIEVLHTDGNSIAVARSELAGAPFTVKGAPQFCYHEAGGTNLASVVVTVDVARPDTITASVLLVDGEGKYVATARTSETVGEVGERTLTLTFNPAEVKASGLHGPYTISYLLLKSGNEGVEDVRVEDFVVRDVLYLEQVAAPSLSPATKTVFFGQSQVVAISCATPAAEIRYTLDGSEPTADSALYEGALVVSNSVTVKAKAFVEGLSPSETVEAEYVRAAIVGANLVQNSSPGQGEPQTLSIPAPGTYRVSFDYTQGGDVELYMMRGGVTNRLAVVSAATAGSTNFLFDVAAAGDYELVVRDVSSGVSHVTNLSVSIRETPDGKGIYWIYETEETYGLTGTWLAEHGFVNGKMPVQGNSTFTPYTQSDGRFVTVEAIMEFKSYLIEGLGAQLDFNCGVGIGTTEGGKRTFRVLTLKDGVRTTIEVGAPGLGEPTLDTPYRVKFMVDCTNRTYSVCIVSDENVEMQLAHGTTNEFAFATQQGTAIQKVEIEGEANVMSLSGNYTDHELRFMDGDILPIAGGQNLPALTVGQAAWLNSMQGYDAVKAKVATMGLADFKDAYLLNLDISQSEFGLGMFKVTGIEVTEDEVRISVTLNRAGAMQVSRGGASHDAPINGLLKLYGGESPGDRTLLNATVITDDSFSSGDTEVFTYPRSGPARFFCPAIVSP